MLQKLSIVLSFSYFFLLYPVGAAPSLRHDDVGTPLDADIPVTTSKPQHAETQHRMESPRDVPEALGPIDHGYDVLPSPRPVETGYDVLPSPRPVEAGYDVLPSPRPVETGYDVLPSPRPVKTNVPPHPLPASHEDGHEVLKRPGDGALVTPSPEPEPIYESLDEPIYESIDDLRREPLTQGRDGKKSVDKKKDEEGGGFFNRVLSGRWSKRIRKDGKKSVDKKKDEANAFNRVDGGSAYSSMTWGKDGRKSDEKKDEASAFNRVDGGSTYSSKKWGKDGEKSDDKKKDEAGGSAFSRISSRLSMRLRKMGRGGGSQGKPDVPTEAQ